MDSVLIWRFFFQVCLTIVLVFGLVGAAAGTGLLVRRAWTLRMFAVMNRWVSVRRALRTVEIPRDIDAFVHKHRSLVGVLITAGGVFATFGLYAQIGTAEVSAAAIEGPMVHLLDIATRALKWSLLAGAVSSVVFGLMLWLSSESLGRIERMTNRWISPRRLLRGVDRQHLELDGLVEAYPRPSAWFFVIAGLGAAAYAVFLLSTRL